jgi:hypothetical protein
VKSAMLVLGLIGFAAILSGVSAQDGAHTYFEQSGDWRIISNNNAVTGIADFWMASPAVKNENGLLSIQCDVNDQRYSFVLGDRDLAHLPFGQQIVLDVRVSNDKPFKVAGASTGQGNIVIDEIANQPSFTALLATLALSSPPAFVAFALGPNQWFFSLRGFLPLSEKLGQHCGFTPDPARVRKRERPR